MRDNKVMLIVGTRGTGKTDFIKILLYHLRNVFLRLLVVDTFDSFVWKNLKTFKHPEWEAIQVPVITTSVFPRWVGSGIYRMFSSDTEEIMSTIQANANNMVIVFEDSAKYIGNVLTKDVRRFVLDSKQKNLDLVFIFHSLAGVPPDLVRVADTLTLFKTNESKVPAKLSFVPELQKAMDTVKNSANRYENRTIELN